MRLTADAIRSRSRWTLIVLFLALLFSSLCHPGLGHLHFPTSSFAAADRYFQDGFPYRARLVSQFNRLRHSLFKVFPRAVIFGSDDWLFYDSDISRDGVTMDDFRGNALPDEPTLAAWRRHFAERSAWLASKGVPYLAMIVPNKQSVYAEHLPPRVARTRGPTTRADKVVQVAAEEGWPLLDLRRSMIEQKSKGQIFYRADSHWNELGAYWAYRAILDRLRPVLPALKPIELTELDRSTVRGSGDIAAMAFLTDRFVEDIPHLQPRTRRGARFTGHDLCLFEPGWQFANIVMSYRKTFGTRMVVENPDPSLPVAVVFHDSFMLGLMPFLSQHFRRMVYVWDAFDPALVEAEHPDVVIQENVERYLPLLFEEPRGGMPAVAAQRRQAPAGATPDASAPR